MHSLAQTISARNMKKAVVDVRSGDTVRVHQKIVEGGKERVQIFEGLVIKVSRPRSLTANFTVRRLASGIGVEKGFMMHSPAVLKVEVTKRSKVRRNYLTYMRALTGKSARLSSVDFDKESVNAVRDEAAEAEEAKIQEQKTDEHEALAAEAEAQKSELPAPGTKADKLEHKPKLRAGAKNPPEEPNKAQ